MSNVITKTDYAMQIICNKCKEVNLAPIFIEKGKKFFVARFCKCGNDLNPVDIRFEDFEELNK